MARNDKEAIDSYEPDSFDDPPKGPAGMHRGARPVTARLVPFVVVVLVAALCGVGAWGVLSGELGKVRMPWSASSTANASGSSSDSTQKQKTSDKTSDDQAAAEKKAAEEKAAQEKAAAEEQAKKAAEEQAAQEAAAQQAAQPDKTKAVTVVNGTGVSGYAATKQGVLNNAGYTNVVASNPTGALPSATVVWYESDADKATAEDVANTLGISNVQPASGLGGGIVVVLMN
ncbi:LytR C-terminal domain-containing protein [Bifidobacterium aesculapii]|uniref:LytR C-terminal domain-containing protein n=1 Tax=Bifidobacterium aesculapii TaxID=1329411 RepID=UPI0006E1D3C1|nr:LytR C-terminal domain-containing protein [Bifidobacterium aesculapii]